MSLMIFLQESVQHFFHQKPPILWMIVRDHPLNNPSGVMLALWGVLVQP